MKRALALVFALLMVCTSLFLFTACAGEEDGAKVKIIDVNLTDEQYAFAFQKGNTALKNDFDAYLQSIKQSGVFQSILDKYFNGSGEKIGVAVTTGSVVNDANTLVVATNCPFEPFEYIGNDGKMYGVDIEIARSYAEAKGLNLVVKNISFDAILPEVDAGYSDIGMAGITITADRQALYDFSTPYYDASQKLIVMGDNTYFDDCTTAQEVEAKLKALEGKSIGYQTGTTGNWYMAGSEDWGYEGFANITVKGYDTAVDAVNDMMNGNLYAVCVDEAPGTAIVESINVTQWSVKIKTFFSTLKQDYFRNLVLNGLKNTVIIAILGLLIGIVIGTLIGVVKVAPKYNIVVRILDKIATFYVALFRGTPMVVQLLIAYYVLLPAIGVTIGAVWVGVIVFGMNSGAYISEIMRGGINAVDIGQLEAGRAVGLSYGTTMIRIVIPQALKNILPTLGNEFITLIKETSVLSFITVYDLYTALRNIALKNYENMVPYLFMALVYIVLVLLITALVKWIERYFARSDRKGGVKRYGKAR